VIRHAIVACLCLPPLLTACDAGSPAPTSTVAAPLVADLGPSACAPTAWDVAADVGELCADPNDLASQCEAQLTGPPVIDGARQLEQGFGMVAMMNADLDACVFPQPGQQGGPGEVFDPAMVLGVADFYLATTQDMLFVAEGLEAPVADLVDAAASSGCDAACSASLSDLFVGPWTCGFEVPAAPPVVDTSFPAHPSQDDCDRLKTGAEALATAAEAIDCSDLLAAWQAADAAADAAEDAADVAEAAATDAATAAQTARDAAEAATDLANAKAQALADYVDSSLFLDSVSVGANPGGLANSIGVGPIGGSGSMTIYFDGSSTSVDALMTIFADPGFQSRKGELDQARSDMAAAQADLAAKAAASAAARAAATGAAVRATAARAAEAAAKAALDACQQRKDAAAQAAQDAQDAHDECHDTLVQQTEDAVTSSGEAVSGARTAVDDAKAAGLIDGDDAAAADDAVAGAGGKQQEAEDDQEDEDYDGAQGAAAEAEALARTAATLALGGCSPDGATRRLTISDEVVGTRILHGVGNVHVINFRTVHGASDNTKRHVTEELNGAIDALLSAPATDIGGAVGDATYGKFQQEAVAAARRMLGELDQTLAQRDPVVWIRFELGAHLETPVWTHERTIREYTCADGVWVPGRLLTERYSVKGQCREVAGPDTWTWKNDGQHSGTVTPAKALPIAIRELLRRHGWKAGCP